MAHRVAPQAEHDLDDIWLYVAKESNSIEIANDLIDRLSGRFFLLSSFPQMGLARDDDFGEGISSFAVRDYVIMYCLDTEDVLILRVVHGRRDLNELLLS